MEGLKNCVVVTASDSDYCDYLLTMLRSIARVDLPLVVFDVGLTDDERQRIESSWHGDCRVFNPGWCIDLIDQAETPEYKKVFLAKPFLPELLPGYQRYLWVDADICFLDDSAIEDYIRASESNGAAIGYEDHPSYRQQSKLTLLQKLGLKKKHYKARKLEKYFGGEVARRWSSTDTLNSGIFCMHRDSTIWSEWQRALKEANLEGQQRKRLICDQTCLDLAISRQQLPVQRMPATHNWCLGLAQPLALSTASFLVDPVPPHAPVKVLHGTGSEAETRAFMSRFSPSQKAAPQPRIESRQ